MAGSASWARPTRPLCSTATARPCETGSIRHRRLAARLFRLFQHIRLLAAACVASLLTACSTLPHTVERPPSAAIADYTRTPLAVMLKQRLPDDTRSGFMLQPYGPNSFETRMELTRLATKSLDVQYYLLLGDNTGRALMRGLRDAAQRGVRVRLLVDDLYTAGEDELLLGLASYPNVEVRLFNPFPAGRDSQATRFIASGLDFARIDRRMHNKLFVADNAAAMAGGRNMADDYVVNAKGRNFIDMDTFIAGPAVRALSGEFDHYWNSEVVYPIASIAATRLSTEQLQASFEQKTAAAKPPIASKIPADGRIANPDAGDPVEVSPDIAKMLDLPFDLANGHVGPLLLADARVLYDPLTKINGSREERNSTEGTVTAGVIGWLETAHRSIRMVSPYFVPDDGDVASLVRARNAGLDVTLITNSLASTDVSSVYLGYIAHLKPLLRAGVVVEEISPSLAVKRRRVGVFGKRTAALHMKNAIVDHSRVFLGSMNLDPRSARLNTELGILIDSPAMALQLEALSDSQSAYRVRLNPTTDDIEWVSHDDDGVETVFAAPPETTPWQRFWIGVIGRFVPEKEL
ncbi:MAG: phospholipase D/Transphosphatidylase [Rhizobacter sp.]|nr:phospholipase D/Transphosphatidylase [Rhizobacter sp.]